MALNHKLTYTNCVNKYFFSTKTITQSNIIKLAYFISTNIINPSDPDHRNCWVDQT